MLLIWDVLRGFDSIINILLWVKNFTFFIFQKFNSGLRFLATYYDRIWLWFLESNVNLNSWDAGFFNSHNGRDGTNVRGIGFINNMCFILLWSDRAIHYVEILVLCTQEAYMLSIHTFWITHQFWVCLVLLCLIIHGIWSGLRGNLS